MSKRAIAFAILLLIAGVIAIVLVPFIRARNTPAMNACVIHLVQIAGAKQQWALQNHKGTNDVVTWEDIRPYLSHPLQCPNGGTYILGRVCEQPRCSYGKTHVMPQDVWEAK